MAFVHRTQIFAMETDRERMKVELSAARGAVGKKGEWVENLGKVKDAIEKWSQGVVPDLSLPDVSSLVDSTLTSLLSLSDSPLDPTSRLCLIENQRLTVEIQSISKDLNQALKQNVALEAQLTRTKKSLEVQSQVEQELIKRTKIWQRLVQEMHKRGEEAQLNSEIAGQTDFFTGENEQKLNSLTEKIAALEKENGKLRKSVKFGSGEMRYFSNVMLLLSQYAGKKTESIDPDVVSKLYASLSLKQDFRTLSLLQKQQLAEHLLAEGHTLLKKGENKGQGGGGDGLPPVTSPVSTVTVMQEKKFLAMYAFDFDNMTSGLKPVGCLSPVLPKVDMHVFKPSQKPHRYSTERIPKALSSSLH